MKRIPMLLIFMITLFICVASIGNALTNNNVDKAKEFMEAGRYLQAIALLEKEIKEGPTNEEAYYQLGVCFINRGNFKMADKWFSSAFQLKPEYGYKIGNEFKRMADVALKRRGSSAAASLFEKAMIYDPSYKKQGHDFFMSLGDMSQSERYYHKALKYADGDTYKNKIIGLKFLKLAVNKWPGSKCDSLKQKASSLIGEEVVKEIFPSPYMKFMFDETYTDKDADELGNITTFPWNGTIEKGDVVTIKGKVIGKEIYDAEEIQIWMGKWDAEEIQIWKGKNLHPNWILTKMGYYSYSMEQVQGWGRATIRIKKGKGISVTVQVKRKTFPTPNNNLLSRYIKE